MKVFRGLTVCPGRGSLAAVFITSEQTSGPSANYCTSSRRIKYEQEKATIIDCRRPSAGTLLDARLASTSPAAPKTSVRVT